MKDDRLLQLQDDARKAGEALIIISEDHIMLEGKDTKLSELIGLAALRMMAQNEKIASQVFLRGCGGALYGAAIAGLLEDAEITNLSEALAVARAHKQGREN